MNKKKILLINPPQTYYKESSDFNAYFPIGLLYVASLIKNLGNVKIFDCLVEEFKTTEIKDGNIYGTSYYQLEKEIRKFKPQIIGITIPFSCQLNNALKVARLCKRINSKVIVVVGGPDPSIRGKKILEKNKSIDICVLGEGEYTFLEIVKNYRNYQIQQISSITGILYRNSEGRVIKNKSREYIKELDKLPFPAYNLIDFDKYFSHPFLYANRSAINKKSMSIFTSRGCPFNCIFCSIHLHMGKRYRAHSPEYVIRHLKLLIEKYKIKNFHFEDDNVSLDKKRFEKILDLIIKNNLRISWDTPNGIRADTLTYNLLKKIKKSGCTDLRIAIESGDQRILNDVVKKT
jgi:anaerobic magnesium-protoporphyrin IX monomethyl ester cyclase